MTDWNKIRMEYVSGTASLTALGRAYGVNASTVRNRAAKEGWSAERTAYRTESRQKAMEMGIRDSADSMAKLFQASEMLDDVALAMLRELTENGLDIIIGTRQPCRELESLSRCLDNCETLKRRLLGLLAPKEKAQIDLAREKLNMERSKNEKENDNEIRLIVDPQIAEWAK